MNTKQAAVHRSKAQEKSLKLREQYWPSLKDDDLWHRKKHQGFTTIPRTMPHLMNIIDSLSKNQPAGQAYFILWCRAFDESLIVIENPSAFAAESGFTGERALTTWRQRMRKLQELGFIDCKDGSSGPFHYVLLRNPHTVARKLKDQIQEGLFRQLLDRAFDIGAKDMTGSYEY